LISSALDKKYSELLTYEQFVVSVKPDDAPIETCYVHLTFSFKKSSFFFVVLSTHAQNNKNQKIVIKVNGFS
ncbi:MAG: hypothetical protein ACTJF5_08345, partial [Leuconostoc falkenbergense]|uniref:hypothetical protein n=1 Tax=Leuconostoc falkenbergense TaxID=2766470 RepID=UPI003F9820C0